MITNEVKIFAIAGNKIHRLERAVDLWEFPDEIDYIKVFVRAIERNIGKIPNEEREKIIARFDD